MSTPTTLQAASHDRKARLARLRNSRKKSDSPQDQQTTGPEPTNRKRKSPSDSTSPELTKLHLSGRNYDLETRGPRLGFEKQPSDAEITLEKQAKALTDESRRQQQQEAENNDEPVDLFNLRPKKPTWDLKRHLDRKLEVLNVRTDNAIARIVRDQVQKAQKEAAANSKIANGQTNDETDVEPIGMDGTTLVEATRERERGDYQSDRESDSSEGGEAG